MNRRTFVGLSGAAAAAALTGGTAAADDNPCLTDGREFVGVLVDTTRCIGCRACEVGCARAHDLPVPDVLNDGALDRVRTPSVDQWTVVNRYQTDRGTVYVKQQCMHCWQPACAAACPTNAMFKTKDGPVIWRGDKCLGCRYCMISCPFEIPRFEYGSSNPRIRKCIMCWDRLTNGEIPACVAACPVDALMFGLKRELMEIARVRIYNHPGHYHHHIYGEHEVGGTGWLYLNPVECEQLGFRTDLGTTPYPEYTREFLYSVPVAFMLAPAALIGLHQLANRARDPQRPENG